MNLFRKKSIDKIVQDAALGMTDGHSSSGLKKELGVRDLTFMGIAAVVGAGIFSTIGTAAFHGGPGISLLFVITAITCGFLHSSAVVEMASKPMNAKNTADTPANTPLKPLGINGVQFAVST